MSDGTIRVIATARVAARMPATMMTQGVILELNEDGTTTWRPEDPKEFSAHANWSIR